jgi:hypothetical protein
MGRCRIIRFIPLGPQGSVMETTFQVCAIVGGTVIVFQFLLTLIGVGGDHDGDDAGHAGAGHADALGHHDGDHHHAGAAEHGSGWFFSMLTVRTLAAAAAFFGLTGLAARRAELEDLPTILLASGAGLAAFFLVGWLMRMLHKLNVDGTVRIERSVGCTGNVYLKIPGARQGVGKVHVSVHSRTQEYQAVTAAQELPTGAAIVVVGVIGPDTVEVAPALERQTHA